MEKVLDFSKVNFHVQEHYVRDENSVPRIECITSPKENDIGDADGEVYIAMYLAGIFPFQAPSKTGELLRDVVHILSTDYAVGFMNEVGRYLGGQERVPCLAYYERNSQTGELFFSDVKVDLKVANTTVWVGQFMLGFLHKFVYYSLADALHAEGTSDRTECDEKYKNIRAIADIYLKLAKLPASHCSKFDIIQYADVPTKQVVVEIGRDSLVVVPLEDLKRCEQASNDEHPAAQIMTIEGLDPALIANLTRKGYVQNGPITELVSKYCPLVEE